MLTIAHILSGCFQLKKCYCVPLEHQRGNPGIPPNFTLTCTHDLRPVTESHCISSSVKWE